MFANIIIRNLKPRDKSDSIALNTVFSFDLIPFGGDEIDITTLYMSLKVTNTNIQSQNYNFTYNDTYNVTTIGDQQKGYRVSLDISPDYDTKFDSNSNIELKISVNNTAGTPMRRAIYHFSALNLSNIESLMDLLSEVTEISVLAEQGRISADGKTVTFTWDNWSLIEDPVVYKNDVIITSGFRINKSRGHIVFDSPLRNGDPTDRVEADYKHGVFTQEQLVRFMEKGIAVYNAYPRQTNYGIKNAPIYARAALEIGGAYFALSAILNGLINQQSLVRWGDPDKRSEIEGIIKSNMSEYKAILDKIYEMKKLRLAHPLSMVLVEYTLPGGRSRFFRNIFGTGQPI